MVEEGEVWSVQMNLDGGGVKGMAKKERASVVQNCFVRRAFAVFSVMFVIR
jgi:hypothetical protein